jgi:hypothetical protein
VESLPRHANGKLRVAPSCHTLANILLYAIFTLVLLLWWSAPIEFTSCPPTTNTTTTTTIDLQALVNVVTELQRGCHIWVHQFVLPSGQRHGMMTVAIELAGLRKPDNAVVLCHLFFVLFFAILCAVNI